MMHFNHGPILLSLKMFNRFLTTAKIKRKKLNNFFYFQKMFQILYFDSRKQMRVAID